MFMPGKPVTLGIIAPWENWGRNPVGVGMRGARRLWFAATGATGPRGAAGLNAWTGDGERNEPPPEEP